MADQLPIDLRRWIVQLGKLTANRISSDEAADFVDAVQPMLATRFPPAAFTLLSLEHVAAQCKFLPSYGEITQHLGEWWREHRPRPTAILYQPAAPRPEPTAEERAHALWAVKQVTAMVRSSEQVERRPTPRYLTPEQLTAAGFKRVEPPKRSA